MHFQISSPHCVQVGMDRAINNLTIPLGQLQEEIMVCTPPSCIKTPVCDFCLDTRLSRILQGRLRMRLAFVIVVCKEQTVVYVS